MRGEGGGEREERRGRRGEGGRRREEGRGRRGKERGGPTANSTKGSEGSTAGYFLTLATEVKVLALAVSHMFVQTL